VRSFWIEKSFLAKRNVTLVPGGPIFNSRRHLYDLLIASGRKCHNNLLGWQKKSHFTDLQLQAIK